jgi:hypothetical protein
MAAPFSMEWSGFIKAPETGTYQFALESDDGSWLEIDGQQAIDNGGLHATVKVNRTVTLTGGFHAVKVRYFDAGGGAILRFLWTRPGQSEQPVPADVFFIP